MRRSLLICLVVLGLAAAPATAIVKFHAVVLAGVEQLDQCESHGNLAEIQEWRCANAAWQRADCWRSSLRSGRGQWLCVGAVEQADAIGRARRVCPVRVRYDAWGHRISLRVGPCSSVSAFARPRR